MQGFTALMLFTMEDQSTAEQARDAEPVPMVELRQASKLLQLSVSETRQVFSDLSLMIHQGDRLALFAVEAGDATALLQCISGVEQPDRGSVEHFGSVSWPVGSNQAFSGRLSGYANARFAAELYSQPGCLEADLQLIQELAQVHDAVFHEPLSSWPGAQKEALKLAVSLAFEFDVLSVGKISNWDFRAIHPHAARIRELFEQRIEGRTLVMAAPGQNKLAIEYCDEGLVLLDGALAYRGDPEVCLELVKEETQRLKLERKARVNARVQQLLRQNQAAADDDGEEEADVAFA
jgi:ABC-type polysaccharide/polyol phosphate transport system ATPase subunit